MRRTGSIEAFTRGAEVERQVAELLRDQEQQEEAREQGAAR
jgi:hypothetical protein